MDRKLHNIVEYTRKDLMNPEKFEDIYDGYCNYYIYITRSGWEFLIEYYGYETSYEVDKNCRFGFCQYHSSEYENNSLEAYRKWIHDCIESYPKVPDYIYPADTPKGIAWSALRVGKTVEEVMELFGMPLAYVQKLDKEIQGEIAEQERSRKVNLAIQALYDGKTSEEAAEESGVSLEYVLKLEHARKNVEIQHEKKKSMIRFFKNGKSAEETAKKLELSLEYVQDCFTRFAKAFGKFK